LIAERRNLDGYNTFFAEAQAKKSTGNTRRVGKKQ
jgi:hypothetical protein